MTNSISNDIRAALEVRLKATVGSLNGEFDGVPYEPVAGTAFFVATMVSGSDRPATAGTTPTILSEGLFIVKLHYPVGEGAHDLENMADTITAAYPVDQTILQGNAMVRVRYAEVNRQTRVEAGLWLVTEATIAWYCYHP